MSSLGVQISKDQEKVKTLQETIHELKAKNVSLSAAAVESKAMVDKLKAQMTILENQAITLGKDQVE